jgi:UTP:GlnB (protein PII) uridylyltransferase
MSQIKISEVTSQKLRNREYEDVLPEYYLLENFVENNLWHDHQSVLDHVIAVYAGLEKVLEFEDLSDEEKEKIILYLNKKDNSHTRLELMKIASLLHDIAKSKVMIEIDGRVSCPGHELVGASMVKDFAERFGLNKEEESLVERMVRYHGLIAEMLNYIVITKDKEKYLKVFVDAVGDISLELVLMMHSDILGSDLEKQSKKDFDDRIEILIWMNKQLIQN